MKGYSSRVRRAKVKLMYSFSGILAGGGLIWLVLELFSMLVCRKPCRTEWILRGFAVLSAAAVLFLGACSIPLSRKEGFRRQNLFGIFLGMAWMGGNLLCLAVGELFDGFPFWSRLMRLFGCYVDLMLAGLLLMAFLAATHKPAYDKDFIIIPGCSISRQGGLLPLLKGRTDRAIRFAWDQERSSGKPARYIPTGGQGPDEVMSEGSAMEFYLLSHGAEQYEVFPEKASVNTYENMLFSKRIIDSLKPGAKVGFSTTNYHVLRSGMLARRVGLDAEGLASPAKAYFWSNGLAREILAILNMYKKEQIMALGICAILAWFLKGNL